MIPIIPVSAVAEAWRIQCRDRILSPWQNLTEEANDADRRRLARENAANNTQKTFHENFRSSAQITGLVLHATGHQGKRSREGWARFVKANFVIPQDGRILMLHDERERRPSSNSLNRSTVAVEFIGNFANTDGRWHTVGKEQTSGRHRGQRRHVDDDAVVYSESTTSGDHNHDDSLTAQQVAAGRRLVRYLKMATSLAEIWAHCQSTTSHKDNCPGPSIWYNVGEWAIREGLVTPGNNRRKHAAVALDIPDDWQEARHAL